MTDPGLRVLVVEDEVDLGRAFARTLAAAGFPATPVVTGTDALNCMQQQEFDCILTDIELPGMTGVQLLREVRQKDRDLPVILVTGGPEVGTAIQAVDHGAFKYLTKPLDPEMLVETVRQAVQIYQLAKLRREAWKFASESPSPTESDLPGRFDRAVGTLWPAFQPVIAAADHSLYAYEALLRSDEPSLPHPGAVLDAAHQLDRLPDLGRRMRQLAVQRLLEFDSTCDLFLNLHPADLMDPMLLDPNAPHMTVANRIVLEITERASIDGVPDASKKIRTLRDAGCRIAVDDLGAGYAGLASFVQLEPDLVKLDMCLVRDVHQNATKQRLVRSVTQVCADMGLLVVAEGVETPAERDTLVELGCDLLQGYLFGRPQREFSTPTWE